MQHADAPPPPGSTHVWPAPHAQLNVVPQPATVVLHAPLHDGGAQHVPLLQTLPPPHMQLSVPPQLSPSAPHWPGYAPAQVAFAQHEPLKHVPPAPHELHWSVPPQPSSMTSQEFAGHVFFVQHVLAPPLSEATHALPVPQVHASVPPQPSLKLPHCPAKSVHFFFVQQLFTPPPVGVIITESKLGFKMTTKL